ncbi:D-alanyl-D-alanine carboxypeptidase/D-alanyl-D-alanine endopeptidase [Polluticaenibacter yanchengensis]|uniref:D-alanyl-D-alanine carboxypeptidase/D-alanyl-D-alanine-endopeptidase n=1 Tax=Polluticaenibacter yanchengensis TaxID=3014562 RepID=A0ABT4UEJ3_9BACT|nr:D-alanyl-D-alanine carboxypeptidase/D-alanyl-D-alanine-endopeptidase [Chitinophagaceae bacterium LY-5]
MKIIRILFLLLLINVNVFAQTLEGKLATAWNTFVKSGNMDFALAGTYIMNAKTGARIFERNANIGLVPASTMKVFTSFAGYTVLGKDFRYPFEVKVNGKVVNDTLHGHLVIVPSGDPSLGSNRFQQSDAKNILTGIKAALDSAVIKVISGNIIIDSKNFDVNPVPEGWIWGDMGNAYGAGHWPLNWEENVFSFYTDNGKPGTDIILKEQATAVPVIENTKSGVAGTGDKSIVYGSPFSEEYLHQGLVEPDKKSFRNNASIPNADSYAMVQIVNYLAENGIVVLGEHINSLERYKQQTDIGNAVTVYNYQSPVFDSLNYWFMRKSINLYGEAFLKSVALKNTGFAATKNGTGVVDSILKANHVPPYAVRMLDGSGLSPSNRVAPVALAQILYKAKSAPWFRDFYNGFPVYNGMNIKSGTMTAVKCFAGYYTAKNGNEYIVVLMVNNYNGTHANMVNKMYEFLNAVK